MSEILTNNVMSGDVKVNYNNTNTSIGRSVLKII